MQFLSSIEQAIILILICFSGANYLLTISLNKEKEFPQLLGVSFFIPLVLSFYCHFSSDAIFQEGLSHFSDLAFLFGILFLVLSWRWKKYIATVIGIHLYPFVLLLLISGISSIPKIFLNPYFQGGVAFCLTILLIYALEKEIREKEYSLIWGIIILGLIQTIQLVFPDGNLISILGGKSVAYILLYIYLVKKTRETYMDRIKRAEAKLSDMKRTINYEVKKKTLEIELHNEHLQNMVQKDLLLDIYNKKGILSFLKEMIEKSQGFSILLFDIDMFKEVNDTKGHIAGDMVLKKVAHVTNRSIRGCDLFGRYGGDEFLIILPNTEISDALFIGERFRKTIYSETEITVSVGIAVYPDDGKTVQDLIKAADAGLYEVKKRGRNAICHYSSKT